MSQATSKNFQVAIIGGGVCGLACAVALQDAGIAVEVFEAAAAFGEIGAGIGLGPNAVRALKAMGLLDAVLQKLPPANLSSKGFLFYTGVGAHELVYDYPPAPEDTSISMHRADFLDALVGRVDSQRAHFNKRCTSISEHPIKPSRLVVHFADGSTHETDVVLGADGIKSAVRRFVMDGSAAAAPATTAGTDKRVAFSSTAAYRGLIPYAALKAAGFTTPLTNRPARFMGPSKHIIVVPIKNGERKSSTSPRSPPDTTFPSARRSCPMARPGSTRFPARTCRRSSRGGGRTSRPFSASCRRRRSGGRSTSCTPLSRATLEVALPCSETRRMPCCPHLGAGAGQGIEDAFLLVRLLTHPRTTIEDIPAMFTADSRIRQPRSQMVWDTSYHAGSTYDYHGPSGATPEGLCKDLKDLWKPVWRYDVEGDLNAALATLG